MRVTATFGSLILGASLCAARVSALERPLTPQVEAYSFRLAPPIPDRQRHRHSAAKLVLQRLEAPPQRLLLKRL